MTDPLTARLLLLLADGGTRMTADLIAACPDTPGWQVRRRLDELAAAGQVARKRRKRKSEVWRAVRPLNPAQFSPLRKA